VSENIFQKKKKEKERKRKESKQDVRNLACKQQYLYEHQEEKKIIVLMLQFYPFYMVNLIDFICYNFQ